MEDDININEFEDFAAEVIRRKGMKCVHNKAENCYPMFGDHLCRICAADNRKDEGNAI